MAVTLSLAMAKKIAIGGIALHSYGKRRTESNTNTEAIIGAAGDAVVASVIGPGIYMASKAAMDMPKKAVSFYDKASRYARSMERGSLAPFTGNTFIDSKQIFTMRQAGVAAMQQAKYNAENAMLGNEAGYMHR